VYKYFSFNAERLIIGKIAGNQGFGWKKFEVDLLIETPESNYKYNVSKKREYTFNSYWGARLIITYKLNNIQYLYSFNLR